MNSSRNSYEKQLELYNLSNIIAFYITSILLPIGLVGNLIIFVIYAKIELRKHTLSFYYCANAVIDSLELIVTFLQLLQYVYIPETLTDFWCKFIFIFTYSLPTISSFITMMATADRVRLILYSTYLKFMTTRLFQWLFIIILFISWTAIYVPNGLNSYFDSNSCFIVSYKTVNIYSWLFLMAYAIIPSIVVITFSSLLIHSIRRSKRNLSKHGQMSTNKKIKKGNKMATNVLAINLLFTITSIINGMCNLLYTVVAVYFPKFNNTSWGVFSIVNNVFNAIDLVNNAFPIFVHLLTNTLFLIIFKNYVFCRILTKYPLSAQQTDEQTRSAHARDLTSPVIIPPNIQISRVN